MPQGSERPLKFYPAYCWSASPTYNAWVKVSCVDVHSLRRRRGFEAHPRVWFLHNHPIRFVRLVGVVIAYQQASEYTELHGPEKLARSHRRPHVFTIDDGSGEVIDVVLWGKGDLDDERSHIARYPGELIRMSPLDFLKRAGRSVSGDVVDVGCVELGKVVKVKGWIGEYRDKKQILLERVGIIEDTAGEVREWEQLSKYQEEILAKPWSLSNEALRTLKKKDEKVRRRLLSRKKQKDEVDLLDPSQQKDEQASNAKIHIVKGPTKRIGRQSAGSSVVITQG